MSEVDAGVDSLHLLYTGGAANEDPDACLGGAVSSKRVRGAGGLVRGRGISGLRIDDATPACGFTSVSISVDANGDLVFTGSSGAGDPVAIAEGESKIVEAYDPSEALRVYRDVGRPFPASNASKNSTTSIDLLEILNGPLAHRNVTSAQRVAGRTTYRAVMLRGMGRYGARTIRAWLPPVAGQQAVYSLALETTSGSSIQSIPNETTAPTSVAWVTPTTELGALVVPATLVFGEVVGLWIRRAFPAAGHVDLREDVQLSLKWKAV